VLFKHHLRQQRAKTLSISISSISSALREPLRFSRRRRANGRWRRKDISGEEWRFGSKRWQ